MSQETGLVKNLFHLIPTQRDVVWAQVRMQKLGPLGFAVKCWVGVPLPLIVYLVNFVLLVQQRFIEVFAYHFI